MKIFLISVAVAFALFMGTYRLVETPPTWIDEGAIVQVAINLANHGNYGYQLAPDTFISAGFLTTSYPLIFPLALVFKLFGVGLYQARILMLLFILLFIAVSYLLIKEEVRESKSIIPALSILIIVSFAPLYGHGKNVLGEVPGLLFFVLMLYFISVIEKGSQRWGTALTAGLCAGLAMSTKPIYLIVVLPALFVVMFWLFRIRFSVKKRVIFIIGCLLPVLCWFLIRIMSDSFIPGVILGNPDNFSTLSLIKANVRRIFLEPQVMYYTGLVFVWWVSIFIRRKRNKPVSTIELMSIVFSSFNFFAYIFTLGYYRYFFPGELVALIFLVNSLRYVFDFIKLRIFWLNHNFFLGMVIILILFQTQQTVFSSWISEYKYSNRSALLSQNLGLLPSEKSVFFYNVPEAVIFLDHINYFQYIEFSKKVVFGEENIFLLKFNIPDFILVDHKFDQKILSKDYVEKIRFDKYVLFEKSDKLKP